MLQASYKKHTLQFITPGGTSRGVLTTKNSWYIQVWDVRNPTVSGVGECSILPHLSIDDKPGFEDKLRELCANINRYASNYRSNMEDELLAWPAIRFGLEMALLDLKNGGHKTIFASDFVEGKKSIPINGLIWMGEVDYMKEQLAQKIDSGFKCIKMKIGAIDFEQEINLIREIRKTYNSAQLEIRVDANGAFNSGEALAKLNELAKLGIHSIEQPIKAGQWQKMAGLCAESPVDIALDEELIGISDSYKREELLATVKPAYIILKPSLLGGFKACDQWVQAANKLGIAWWATSALEGNIGLNAIAQWTAIQDNTLPQGLGTGQVFANNIASPLEVKNGHLIYNKKQPWGTIP
ncbi:o-succinylbenzoate synthase [Saccharicrinis carchari]|uniref:O-succinylbenzoate synthase n=1 Tax=Saccharicrinis carchari TaxID=1168039 RepID=A0A521EP72_SACCC|nr:o-succinylbenzoate synthase [Saccharicrinis carchari]SMO85714.1 o-succinylbenzoate synthase [Saccharicrinis carchari]